MTRDGKFVLAALYPGNMTRIIEIPSDGRSVGQTILTLTTNSVYLDAAPDGTIYLDQHPYLMEIVP